MTTHEQHRSRLNSTLTLLIAVGLSAAAVTAQAQTYTVIHNFTGGADGAYPYAGLTIDAHGNFYGTANQGGHPGICPPQNLGCGTVYKLARAGSGWVFTPLYKFTGEPDGGGPYGRVSFGPDGALYGSTVGGGLDNCVIGFGCGTVYRLRPSPTACQTALCPWNESVIYRFMGGTDAYSPTGDVAFDSAGAMYGTT